MPAEYWDNLTKLGDIFESLKASGVAGAQGCPYQTIQKHIIMEEWQVSNKDVCRGGITL